MIVTAVDQLLYVACLTADDVAYAGTLPIGGTLASPLNIVANADLGIFLAKTHGTRSHYRPLPEDGGTPGEFYGVGTGLVYVQTP